MYLNERQIAEIKQKIEADAAEAPKKRTPSGNC